MRTIVAGAVLVTALVLVCACGTEESPHSRSAQVPAMAADSLGELFAVKPPWEYPEHTGTEELNDAIDRALQDFRTVNSAMQLRARKIHFDEGRGYYYLTFDSPVVLDTYVVYVYEASSRRLLGHVSLARA